MMVFASMSWAGGAKHWMAAELRGLRSLQTRMTRRLGRWWPRATGLPSLRQENEQVGDRQFGECPYTGSGCRGGYLVVALGWPPWPALSVGTLAVECPHIDLAGCLAAPHDPRRASHGCPLGQDETRSRILGARQTPLGRSSRQLSWKHGGMMPLRIVVFGIRKSKVCFAGR